MKIVLKKSIYGENNVRWFVGPFFNYEFKLKKIGNASRWISIIRDKKGNVLGGFFPLPTLDHCRAQIKRIEEPLVSQHSEATRQIKEVNDCVRMFDNIETDTGRLTKEQRKRRHELKILSRCLHGKLIQFRNDLYKTQLNINFK